MARKDGSIKPARQDKQNKIAGHCVQVACLKTRRVLSERIKYATSAEPQASRLVMCLVHFSHQQRRGPPLHFQSRDPQQPVLIGHGTASSTRSQPEDGPRTVQAIGPAMASRCGGSGACGGSASGALAVVVARVGVVRWQSRSSLVMPEGGCHPSVHNPAARPGSLVLSCSRRRRRRPAAGEAGRCPRGPAHVCSKSRQYGMLHAGGSGDDSGERLQEPSRMSHEARSIRWLCRSAWAEGGGTVTHDSRAFTKKKCTAQRDAPLPTQGLVKSREISRVEEQD